MNYLFLSFGIKQSSIGFSTKFRCNQAFYKTYLISKSSKKSDGKGLEKALEVLDLFTPKTCSNGQRIHLRLMQGCIQEFLEAGPKPRHKKAFKTAYVNSNSKRVTQNIPSEILDYELSWCWGRSNKSILPKEDGLSWFLEMHKEGVTPDAVILSGILSSCGTKQTLYLGMQIHSFAIKAGFDLQVAVGSSLITLYAKCGELNKAYLVFENMPVRNNVSWTAVITGFAQHWQVETSLALFHQMRQSALKPNDLTFTSILSVCTDSGYLGQGKRLHCLIIQMGYNSYIHVSNALISMYAKCGLIKEANYMFKNMMERDLVSWNSMIAGYAQHGFLEKAVNLLKNMTKHNIVPDSLTYLAVLSSCRHVGHVEQGRSFFKLMLEQGIKPELDHYSCMVDLLGRAGLIEEAWDFIKNMPYRPNAIIWGSVLSSCKLHGNVWIGIQAAENRLVLEPSCAATHVQLVNLYASVGYWEQVAKVRKSMKEKGLKPSTGYSWIEVKDEVYRFRAEDRFNTNTNVNEIFTVVDCLVTHMRSLDYAHKANLSGRDEGVQQDNYCADGEEVDPLSRH